MTQQFLLGAALVVFLVLTVRVLRRTLSRQCSVKPRKAEAVARPRP